MMATARNYWRSAGWVLTVLAVDPALAGADLVRAIGDTVLRSSLPLYRTFDRGFGHRDPAEVALDLLAAFGSVADEGKQERITPLGRWVLPVLSTSGVSLLGPSRADRVVDGICQLKIVLRYVRPACWQRVLVPASASSAPYTRSSRSRSPGTTTTCMPSPSGGGSMAIRGSTSSTTRRRSLWPRCSP